MHKSVPESVIIQQEMNKMLDDLIIRAEKLKRQLPILECEVLQFILEDDQKLNQLVTQLDQHPSNEDFIILKQISTELINTMTSGDIIYKN